MKYLAIPLALALAGCAEWRETVRPAVGFVLCDTPIGGQVEIDVDKWASEHSIYVGLAADTAVTLAKDACAARGGEVAG